VLSSGLPSIYGNTVSDFLADAAFSLCTTVGNFAVVEVKPHAGKFETKNFGIDY